MSTNNFNAIKKTMQNLYDSIGSYGVSVTKIPESDKRVETEIAKLFPGDLEQIRMSLAGYNDIIKDGPIPGERQSQRDHRHLKKFLKKYQLQVSNEVFSNLDDRDLIEIYSEDHKQIFRSIDFFSLSRYDLNTLTFIPWDQLFYRDAKDFETIVKEINYVLENEIKHYTPLIPKHIMSEVESQRKFYYKMKRLACVFDENSNGIIGYLTVISVKEIGSHLNLVH